MVWICKLSNKWRLCFLFLKINYNHRHNISFFPITMHGQLLSYLILSYLLKKLEFSNRHNLRFLPPAGTKISSNASDSASLDAPSSDDTLLELLPILLPMRDRALLPNATHTMAHIWFRLRSPPLSCSGGGGVGGLRLWWRVADRQVRLWRCAVSTVHPQRRHALGAVSHLNSLERGDWPLPLRLVQGGWRLPMLTAGKVGSVISFLLHRFFQHMAILQTNTSRSGWIYLIINIVSLNFSARWWNLCFVFSALMSESDPIVSSVLLYKS